MNDKNSNEASSNRPRVLILVPEDAGWINPDLDSVFENTGWDVNYVNDINSCFDFVEEYDPDLLIVDSNKEGYQGLIAHLRAQWSMRTLPVVLVHDAGFDRENPGELVVFGDKLVEKPQSQEDPMQRESLVAESQQLLKSFASKSEHKQTVQLCFPTETKYLNQAKNFCDMLVSNTPLGEEESISMKAAVREAVQNAAQHGNRYRSSAHIHCAYLRDNSKLMFRVKDEGDGFDHEEFLKNARESEPLDVSREEHEKGKFGGFGILLMLRCADKLTYNDKGNQLTLIKKLSN